MATFCFSFAKITPQTPSIILFPTHRTYGSPNVNQPVNGVMQYISHIRLIQCSTMLFTGYRPTIIKYLFVVLLMKAPLSAKVLVYADCRETAAGANPKRCLLKTTKSMTAVASQELPCSTTEEHCFR